MASSSIRIRRTVGIDLGTTNSVIAQLDDTGSTVLTGTSDQGRFTFPSLVAWDSERGRLVAGPEALAYSRGKPNATALPLSSVKRFMGLDRTFPVGPKNLSPQGASAVILHNLRDWMSRTLADPRRIIDRAILTMPAYFNHNQIEATRKAGELAGYEVVELLHEPTAAATYYSWLHGHGDATYLVYDLGGGTFDVSIIRRRLNDHEVISVSGDPFLGGDDFDRLLSTEMLHTATWTASGDVVDVEQLFVPGTTPFGRLMQIAEQVKIELSSRDEIRHYVPRVLTFEDGRDLSLEVSLTRARLEKLIHDKIQRTIDCCHEALARAKQQAGIRLGDVDHVVLVGGSSRLPLVRQVVQRAFADHVRNREPLLHEPDLCVAYGAALRAAGYGTRYHFYSNSEQEGAEIQLLLTSPLCTRELPYLASGRVSGVDAEGGASVRVRSLATGLISEAFLEPSGAFACEVELQAEADNVLDWTICDSEGETRAGVRTQVRHQATGRPLGQGVLPTQLITKPLSIEVLTRSRQKIKQIVAPLGSTLPGVFCCTCRTSDQSGRIVVPIFEENRIVHQLVIDDVDSNLPVGSPVEVEFTIDVRHVIEVQVSVDPARRVRAKIDPPPPPSRPTRQEIYEVIERLRNELEQLSGRVRSRLSARASEVQQDLLEAMNYDDEPRAIQRLAELRELLAQAERIREQRLDPPWDHFARLVEECLELASQVASKTGRDRDELFEHVQTQERYAEQAYEDHNQVLYRECWDNLAKYANYLKQLLEDAIPGSPVTATLSPEEEARAEVDHFRSFLSMVWKQARQRQRSDLEARLAEIARQASGLTARLKQEPITVLRDARKLGVEVEKVHNQMMRNLTNPPPDHGGLLEGSS